VSNDDAVEQQVEKIWWLRRWLKNEMFWQGIVVQTLGTLAAAVIIAIVAIIVGVGYTPAIRYYVIYGLAILFIILGAIFTIVSSFQWITIILSPKKYVGPMRPWVQLIFTIIEIVFTLVIFYFLILLIPAIQPLIAHWTGYRP
jgi:hypothetical protein